MRTTVESGWARAARAAARGTLALAVFALTGCGGGADAPSVQGDPSEVTYAPELEVSLDDMERTSSGLYRQDLTEGTGDTATAGSDVVVHYTGWLVDGTEFDTSRGGTPFEFPLGGGQVIPGWDEGVEGMREGGTRRLVIPADLAYGDSGAGGVIPPNATLVFEVELVDVR